MQQESKKRQSHHRQRFAIFSYGFRPFFLFGAIWAVTAMLLWLLMLANEVALPMRFEPISWHAHEFLFGYLGAVLAGFLLTAVPNWTGRLPVVGWRLAMLLALWILGRISILISATLHVSLAPIIDLTFPIVLGTVILREIVAARNWHNLVILILVSIFTLANGIFHIESMNGDSAEQGYGIRLGVATAIMMISMIGGRIIPSFTHNWFVQRNISACPVPPMQMFDKLVLVASALILVFWVLHPQTVETGLALIALGGLHLGRQIRWQPHHVLSEPLLWILHLAYCLIPLGAFCLGTGLVLDFYDSATLQHVWMSGAIGSMTLAMMTRITLGHTGQSLTASRYTTAIYFCVIGAVGGRLGASFMPELNYVAGALWLAAFVGFVLVYGPLLVRHRLDM